MIHINKNEMKYILYASIFMFIVSILVIPNIIKYAPSMSPLVQFAIFNISIFAFFQIFLKSMITRTKISIFYGIGLLALFMAVDISTPPLMLSPDGVLNNSPILSASASDYVMALLGQSIGLSGFMLYGFTYFLVPLILLILASLILKDFVKEI